MFYIQESEMLRFSIVMTYGPKYALYCVHVAPIVDAECPFVETAYWQLGRRDTQGSVETFARA